MTERQLVKIAKALADPTRLRIFRAIAAASTRLCCGEVGRRVPITQATVSHHLRILADARLIEGRRNGQFIHFRAVPSTLVEYRRSLGDLTPPDGNRPPAVRTAEPDRRTNGRGPTARGGPR